MLKVSKINGINTSPAYFCFIFYWFYIIFNISSRLYSNCLTKENKKDRVGSPKLVFGMVLDNYLEPYFGLWDGSR